MIDSIADVIEQLLEVARPGGEPRRRLLKYQDQVARNVMLGPAATRYIHALHALDTDNIECKHLTERGNCKIKKTICQHVENNRGCAIYEKSRPQVVRKK